MARNTCGRRTGSALQDNGGWRQYRRALAPDIAASRKAAPVPERFDLIIGGERPAAGRIDGGALLVAEAIDAAAPRLDSASEFGKLLLVLRRPGRHPLQDGFHRRAHDYDITRNTR